MVVDKIVGAGVGLVFLEDHGLAVEIDILPEHGAIGQGLGNELAAQIVEIMGGDPGCRLADPAVGAVVAVSGHGRARLLHPDQAVEAVVGKDQGPVGDHVAARVIDRGLGGSSSGCGQLVVGGVVAVVALVGGHGRGLDPGNPGHMAAAVAAVGKVQAAGLDPGDIIALIITPDQRHRTQSGCLHRAEGQMGDARDHRAAVGGDTADPTAAIADEAQAEAAGVGHPGQIAGGPIPMIADDMRDAADHPGFAGDPARAIIGKGVGALPVGDPAEAADTIGPLIVGKEDIAPGAAIAQAYRPIQPIVGKGHDLALGVGDGRHIAGRIVAVAGKAGVRGRAGEPPADKKGQSEIRFRVMTRTEEIFSGSSRSLNRDFYLCD